MLYSFLLYLIFVLPLAIKNNWQDGKAWFLQKMINTVITLYVFILLSGNLLRFIKGISNHEFLVLVNTSLVVNIVVSLVYGVISFVVVVQSIRLALRIEKARLFLLKMIPFVWMLIGVDKYCILYILSNEVINVGKLIFIIVMHTIIWGLIFWFYSHKRTKVYMEAIAN